MKEKYELAKKQKLNWQALIIEDLQSFVKLRVRDRLVLGWKYPKIWKEIEPKILAQLEEFENKTLASKAFNALEQLAKRSYMYLYRLFFGIGWATLYAINDLARGTATTQQAQLVSKTMELKGVYKHAVPLDMYAKDYQKMVTTQLMEFAKIEAKEDYTSRVNLRNVAEMTVRNDYNLAQIEDLRDREIKLAWIEPHANCSHRCEPWQGKLYSLDGTYGKTADNVTYEPIENAMNVYYTTKAGKVYKNGCLSGFNCRHRLIPYKKNTKPAMIPADVIAKERKINDIQRAYERKIRYWREIALQMKGVNDKMWVIARKKATKLNSDYVRFSLDNNVPYYPSRTTVI